MSDPNANRPGYKETKVGWIPDDWQSRTLDSVATRLTGHTPDKNVPEYWNGGVKWVSLADSDRLDQGLIRSTDKEISDLGIKHSSARLLPHGTVALLRDASVGRVGILAEEMAVSQHFVAWVCGGELENRYLYYWLLSQRRLFVRMAVGTTIVTIGMPFFAKLEVPVPLVHEQQEIADILSTCDEAIEKTGDLIKAKKRQKKALMQQLLAGKKRLPGFEEEWAEVILGDLVKPISTPVPKPNKPYVAVGIRSHGKGTFHRNVEDPAKVAMDTLYRVEPGDLVVNITFAWEGAIALVKECDAVGYVSHRFPTFRPKSSADIGFLKYLVISQRFIWDLGLVSPGGAGRNRVMNKKDFLKIKLFVPCREEQKAVASILMAADAELVVLESKLKVLKQQKKALMQKLLTGQVRVKV